MRANLELFLAVIIQVVPVFLLFFVRNIDGLAGWTVISGVLIVVWFLGFEVVLLVMVLLRLVVLLMMSAVVIIKASPQRRGHSRSPVRLRTRSGQERLARRSGRNKAYLRGVRLDDLVIVSCGE